MKKNRDYVAVVLATALMVAAAGGAARPPVNGKVPPPRGLTASEQCPKSPRGIEFLDIAPGAASIRLLVFGDQGSGEDLNRHQESVARVISEYYRNRAVPPFVLLLGDNFYPSHMGDEEFADLFVNRYADLLDNGTQFYAVLGNHDYQGAKAAEERKRHGRRGWNMPSNYYALRAGPAVLFGLDTASGQTSGSPRMQSAQLYWLLNGLCALDRMPSPPRWKLVFGHHPLVSGGKHGYVDAHDEMLDRVLLGTVRGRIDLYMAGHDHDMQLLWTAGLPLMANVGSGGRGIRKVYPVLGMTQFCAETHGFAEVELSASEMKISYIAEDRSSGSPVPRLAAVCTVAAPGQPPKCVDANGGVLSEPGECPRFGHR
jgi:hypothetical protein